MSTTTTYTSTNARPCASCFQRNGRCLDSCPDKFHWSVPIIPGDGLSFTGVIRAIENAPQSHAKRRARGGPVPVRYVACVFAGLVLTAIGLLLRDSVALMIWEAIHR